MAKYFNYSAREVHYLKARDERMAQVIDYVGPIFERIDEDMFSAIVYHILGQQISAKVQDKIWEKLLEDLEGISPEKILELGSEKLREYGMTTRKAETIVDLAEKFITGEINPEDLSKLSDEEVISSLIAHNGVGVWTAEMVLMFHFGRENVFSFQDVALKRGLKRIYGFEDITRETFEEFRERFSPYGTVASLYLWAVGEEKVPYIKEFIERTFPEPIEGAQRSSDPDMEE